ncbi:MAG: ferritin-like domain-containing protein [Rhodospirillales bacterium]|nr:ferritin-like domain-containing protein [Rhodospirillales bacterium]
MTKVFKSLAEAACEVLNTAAAGEKAALTPMIAAAWKNGQIKNIGTARPPARPNRSAHPELRPPRDMPRRGFNSDRGRISFIHAIAHIELNAIDLAWDIIARFSDPALPKAFYDDWVGVAEDEARHFSMLANCLTGRASCYGDLPAHDGLWEAASDTADDLLARLAIVPLVLEARGLDATPAAIQRLKSAGDEEAANILAQIGEEEIPHVAAGVRWFEYLCEQRGLEPKSTYQELVKARFKGQIKAPFAVDARQAAGFDAEYYEPLSQ